MNRPPRAAGLAALLLLGGCNSEVSEVATAVLGAAPFITILVFVLAWVYAELWRPLLDGPVRFRAGTMIKVIALQLVLALFTMHGCPGTLDGDFILMAVWAVGATHLALAMVLLRRTMRYGTAPFAWLVPAPWLLFYPPALLAGFFFFHHPPVRLDPARAPTDLPLILWIVPGGAGLVAGGVALGLLAEVVVRRVRCPPRPVAAEPPPVPAARARFRD